MELKAFCAKTGIDEAAASQALSRSASDDGAEMPWYAEATAGVLAWVTVIAVLLFAAAVVRYGLGLPRPGVESVLAGVAMLAVGLRGMANPAGAFRSQAATAVGVAGLCLACAGLGFELGTAAVSAAFAVAIAVVIATREAPLSAQFLASSLAATLVCATLFELGVSDVANVLAIAAPIGLALFLFPPRRSLDATALVLLLIVPVLAMEQMLPFGGGEPRGGLVARLVDTALTLSLLVMHWRRNRSTPQLARVMGLGIVALCVGLVLPAGASGALLIMVLAFVMGSRPLAVVGTLLLIAFVGHVYAVWEQTMLTKSATLIAVGIVLLAVPGGLALTRARTPAA